MSWTAVLIQLQELPTDSALRGILANMAFAAFGIALGALTGSAAAIALIWFVAGSIANYYLSYNYPGDRRYYFA